MDTDAARRARRRTFKADLTDAYTDEEATPPEWLDLFSDIRAQTDELRSEVVRQTRRFVEDTDIKRALDRRSRVAEDVRRRVALLNEKIKRMNLLAPQARFTRAALDADELLMPLYRSSRVTNPGDRPVG